ncbi:hypothetical protein MHH60_29805 [Paenibacillus sp. FSL H7-0716]|uniref:Transcriptional regulator n=1 Tax=Paenibacillus odorifer TaxID=189426 RepID=A0AB36J7G3_9BACL|nr:hypothetical protein [Paenibacillus odorifer]OME11066.1 hypothetical protein BSK47_29605 [Paenibacillus odorifer]
MALSKCGSCGATGRWEITEVSPTRSRFKFFFVQCSNCGVPVGVVDYNHNSSEHDRILEGIAENKKEVGQVKGMLDDIGNALNRLMRK